jgi:hypothetical protein
MYPHFMHLWRVLDAILAVNPVIQHGFRVRVVLRVGAGLALNCDEQQVHTPDHAVPVECLARATEASKESACCC